jgi:hypothetical protein
MILVRTEFQCKFGRVQEAIESFKAMAADLNSQNVVKRSRIMTDLSGRFDTVVVESEVESIDAYFAMLHAAFADPEFQAAQNASADSPFQTGQRNFYTIEANYE